MSYYKKYLKYKNKYLALKNQSGGNQYAAIQYQVNEDGTVQECKLFRTPGATGYEYYEQVYPKTLTDLPVLRSETPYYDRSQIMDVYFEKKVCSSFSCEQFRDSIARFRLDRFLEQILLSCLHVDFLSKKISIITNLDRVRDNDLILYFADTKSLNLYLSITKNHSQIFFGLNRDDLKWALYNSLSSIYSPDILNEVAYRFHILHGIIFSYDIKDIYGFLRDYKTKSEESHAITAASPIIQNYITPDDFFTLLNEIVQLILSYTLDTEPKDTRGVLDQYTRLIY
jgi:hypothetical protein